VKYAFIKEHRQEFRLLSMCRVLKVHRSGYYAWLKEPQSPRVLENAKLSEQIRYYYDQSMGIYGSPRIYHDLKEAGISCSENRVARLMKASQLRSIRGYKRPHVIGSVDRLWSPPTSYSVNLPMTPLIRLGSLILPISAPRKAGFTWRW